MGAGGNSAVGNGAEGGGVSDTPDTDEQVFAQVVFDAELDAPMTMEVVEAGFARKLERERDRERRDAERYRAIRRKPSLLLHMGSHYSRAAIDAGIDAAIAAGYDQSP